ncbi:lytic transglycosylase domain-containing protein [Spirosoma soli]|uniref:Lytic transglycosylase domain-containing protein n=1 Tax=Spirosoma soli TaxID=1770529 RepID=A0ABW5M451_9BACT
MTKYLLLVAAGIGCSFTRLSAVAQPATNFIALHTETSAAIKPTKGIAAEPIDFCGENIPTTHPDITARWTRTLNHQAALAGSLTLLKRRAAVVFPFIEPILKQYRIPSDFKFLPLLESAVTNRAVSRRGAAGFWQLMPQTAQSLGLSISHRRDERFNLKKATHAACRYLNELYDQLGSWMLVATAYNAGPNYIQQLSRQYPNRHPMALPYRAPETKAYLFQAVAVKELLTHPQAYRDRLSTRHLAALSEDQLPMAAAERADILASFDMNESAMSPLTGQADAAPAFIADSTTNVVLLIDDGLEPGNERESEPADSVHHASEPVVAAPINRLITRSMSEGTLTEGQLCIFQVVQPIKIDERSFNVGDLIHAHIDVIDAASGRVFLHTDRLTTALTQETVPLKLVATEHPHQPGVALPTRLENWKLEWEQL